MDTESIVLRIRSEISFYMNMRMNRMKVNNVWKVTGTYKILLIIISFLTAFALGANTFGSSIRLHL